MAFFACVESAWNVPTVYSAQVALKPDCMTRVAVALQPCHALFATKRPWMLAIHGKDGTGMFVCADALPLAGSSAKCVCAHASGATVHVRALRETATQLLLLFTAASKAVHGRVLVHRQFSNDGAALLRAVHVPALMHARALCDRILCAKDEAAAHAASRVLVHAALLRADMSAPPLPREMTDAEQAELQEWMRSHVSSAHVPVLTCVPHRLCGSAVESEVLACGAATLAAMRQDSLCARMAAFVSDADMRRLRDGVESVSTCVNEVYSVCTLCATEQETNSRGTWLSALHDAVRAELCVAIDALVRKTV